MAQDAEAVTDEFRLLGGVPADWLRRFKAVRADPQVRAAQAAHMALIERAIGEGLAARLGANPETDAYPWVLAAAAAGVTRACMAFWAGPAGAVQLGDLIDQAFQALADGLPENGPLRQAAADETVRKDSH